jgi:beta-lactamase superfamily II metal-dependent hydrolase
MGGLLATQADLRAEVLYVPHHGASEPVLPEFVRAVRPTHAVISGEERDPAELATVQALFKGAWLANTFFDGTVQLRATADGWRAKTRRRGTVHFLGLKGR